MVLALGTDAMPDGPPTVELGARSDPLWEQRFRAALLRLSRLFAEDQLRSLLRPDSSHELFWANASTLRSAATPDQIPGSLHSILGQYFVDLEPTPVEILPEKLELGSNFLGALSPIQGVLLAAKFTGRDAGGAGLGARGVIFCPNYSALPAHLAPHSQDEEEIVVYVGARETFGAAHDRSHDALVVDRIRVKSSEIDRG